MTSQKSREIIFHLMYSFNFTLDDALEDLMGLFMRYHKVPKKTMYELGGMFKLVCLKKNEVEQVITRFVVDYTLDRIPYVERTILQLGVYELFFSDRVPPKVVISEAVRLARKFGTQESGSFVNAVLDRIYWEQCLCNSIKTEI